MERTLSLKEINLNDKRTKWITLSIVLHVALLSYQFVNERNIFMSAPVMSANKIPLQIKRPVKKKVLAKKVEKKKVKKLDKVARKKVVKKVEEVKEVESNQPINNIITDENILKSLARNSIKPVYPRILQRRGVTGSVRIQYLILPSGEISEVKVLESSHKLFEKSALKALSELNFRPLPVSKMAIQNFVFKF